MFTIPLFIIIIVTNVWADNKYYQSCRYLLSKGTCNGISNNLIEVCKEMENNDECEIYFDELTRILLDSESYSYSYLPQQKETPIQVTGQLDNINEKDSTPKTSSYVLPTLLLLLQPF